MNEVWILGATGRVGRACATALAGRGLSLVLVGRDPDRLGKLARSLGGPARIVVAASVAATIARLSEGSPRVVLHTIGPFAETGVAIARACGPGTHYVDISNELTAVIDLLALHDEAAAAGRCLVTGAGFGFLATESVVQKLCEGRPHAARVRVTAVPALKEGGVVGDALAATLVDGLVRGSRRYEGGRLVRVGIGSDAEGLTTPDGARSRTAAAPTGDLEAARRASGADFVVAASGVVPTAAMARLLVRAMAWLVSFDRVRGAATRRLAKMSFPPPSPAREHSWGHARIEWKDGSVREGWLRAGDAMAFTVGVAVEVVSRLAAGDGRPGAHTAGSLFGPDLAVAAGGQFLLEGLAA